MIKPVAYTSLNTLLLLTLGFVLKYGLYYYCFVITIKGTCMYLFFHCGELEAYVVLKSFAIFENEDVRELLSLM